MSYKHCIVVRGGEQIYCPKGKADVPVELATFIGIVSVILLAIGCWLFFVKLK